MNYQVRFEIDQALDNRRILMGPDSSSAAGSASNVRIHVTNNDTLDEYEGQSLVNNDYMPKLQSWIQKKKFSCTENYRTGAHTGHEDHESVLELQVDIFKFGLKKIEKSDMDKIKEEMEALKHERLMIDREMKLFNFHFFSTHAKDNKPHAYGMNNLNQQFGGFGVNSAANHGTIFSVEQLYHVIPCTGVVEVRDAAPQADHPMINDHNLEPSAFSDELSRSNNLG